MYSLTIPTSFSKEDYQQFILVADIGGTNCNMAIFGKNEGSLQLVYKKDYPTQEITEFHAVVNEVLKTAHDDYHIEIADACFAIAGPLNTDKTEAKLTNESWGISIAVLKEKTLLKSIKLLNDFEAISNAIPQLNHNDPEQVVQLKHEKRILAQPSAVKAVIGAGTGLGMSILVPHKDKYTILASEGGHAAYTPEDELEWALVSYIRDRITNGIFPDKERVVSGMGLSTIYEFLTVFEYEEQDEVTELINKTAAKERPSLITKHYHDSGVCKKTVEIFMQAYARAARDLALTSLSYGGLYLAGGIAPKIISILQKRGFMQTFIQSEKHSTILRSIPVFVIMDYEISLVGCAAAL